MAKAKFSVIIPAYNNAEYLDDAITSVLNQTYPDFELIVVNDASPDNAAEVIQSYRDPRVRYIEHEVNKGLSAARNTGIRNALGEYIALLDGDDYFHPDKLQAHAEFLDNHPEIGSTYNARFELNHSSKTIRDIWRPPREVGLKDLIFGYPFGPSDMVIRREWALRVNMFDDYYVYVGEDLDFNCRLALAGCKFASVDRALNYRRYHSNRIIKNIGYFVDSTLRAIQAAVDDSRCPAEIRALQEQAYASHYILWSMVAFAQGDTKPGQEYCLAAVQRNPSLLAGQPNQVLKTLMTYSIVDESQDHDQLVRKMFAQLPAEMAGPGDPCDWAVGRGYLWRFVRALIWDRPEAACSHFEKALEYKAALDRSFLYDLTSKLIDYQIEFGSHAARSLLERLIPHLEKLGTRADGKWLRSNYLLTEAFYNYSMKQYADVPRAVSTALMNNPALLSNRGAMKILLTSLFRYS